MHAFNHAQTFSLKDGCGKWWERGEEVGRDKWGEKKKGCFLSRWVWLSIFLMKLLTVNEMHQKCYINLKGEVSYEGGKCEKETHSRTISLVFMLAGLDSWYSVRWVHFQLGYFVVLTLFFFRCFLKSSIWSIYSI